MQEVRIGVRIEEEGVSFFGTEEVNALLQQGHRVEKIEPGDVLVEEVPEEDADEEGAYALAGFELRVTFKAS